MSWVTKVPAWVIPLLQDYVIPDDAFIQTGVDFDSFDGGDGDEISLDRQFTLFYPGIVPSYALEPILQPTTGGINYVLKAKKAVGFYACRTEVTTFDTSKINYWDFPITQRKFGWLTLGRETGVMTEHRISFTKQIHLCVPATLLLLNYDDQFDTSNLFNSADGLVANTVHAQLSPTVQIRCTPLPTWEVWAVKFFQEDGSSV